MPEPDKNDSDVEKVRKMLTEKEKRGEKLDPMEDVFLHPYDGPWGDEESDKKIIQLLQNCRKDIDEHCICLQCEVYELCAYSPCGPGPYGVRPKPRDEIKMPPIGSKLVAKQNIYWSKYGCILEKDDIVTVRDYVNSGDGPGARLEHKNTLFFFTFKDIQSNFNVPGEETDRCQICSGVNLLPTGEEYPKYICDDCGNRQGGSPPSETKIDIEKTMKENHCFTHMFPKDEIDEKDKKNIKED